MAPTLSRGIADHPRRAVTRVVADPHFFRGLLLPHGVSCHLHRPFWNGRRGVFSYVVDGWRGDLFRKAGVLSVINCLLVTVAVITVLAQKEPPGNLQLALIYFTNALPFFL